MKRREFITLLGGGAAAWPLVTRAQQGGRVRRIGVLMNTADANAEGRAGISAFQQVLQELGWAEGRDLRTRFAGARTTLIARANMRQS